MSTISILQVFKDCGQTLLHGILEFSILTFTKCDRTEALVDYLQCVFDRNYCQSNIGIIAIATLETL